MNFGSRSEKVSRRIAQMEADLNRLQKESDTLTGRVAILTGKMEGNQGTPGQVGTSGGLFCD